MTTIENFIISLINNIANKNYSSCDALNGKMEKIAFYYNSALWELRHLSETSRIIISQMTYIDKGKQEESIMYIKDSLPHEKFSTFNPLVSMDKHKNGFVDIYITLK